MRPSGKARTTATSNPAPANSSVAGNRAAIRRATGSFIEIDSPRSPCATPHRKPAYCAAIGGRVPVVAQAFDIRGPRGVAEHRDHRVAGHEMDEREGQRRDAQRYRNERDEAADEVANHLRSLPASRVSRHSGERTQAAVGKRHEAPHAAIHHHHVVHPPQRDVRKISGGELLHLRVDLAARAGVERHLALVQQPIHRGVRVTTAIRSIWWRHFRIEHHEVLMREVRRYPVERGQIEVALLYIGVEGRELVGSYVERDPDLPQHCLDRFAEPPPFGRRLVDEIQVARPVWPIG